MNVSPRRVVAALSDLFLATRIQEVAKQSGVAVEVVTPARILDACRASVPDLLIVDLEAVSEPAALIAALHADAALGTIEVVGFYPHVRHELRKNALEAGLDRVLPRSAFNARLAELLCGEAHTSD